MTMLEDYRTAVYLNNAGVTLLKVHCYLEAKQVLSDAVSAARLTQLWCRRDGTLSLDGSMVEAFDAHDKITHADHYVSKGTKNDSLHALLSVQAISDTDFGAAYDVLSGDVNSFQHSGVYPIRIESAAFNNDTPPEVDIDLLSSVILYNYAITYHTLARVTSFNNSGPLNVAACRLFHLSYSITCQLCVSGLEESTILSKVAALSAFNLKNLIRICLVIGVDDAHMQEYGRRLANYQAFLVNESQLFRHVLSSPAA